MDCMYAFEHQIDSPLLVWTLLVFTPPVADAWHDKADFFNLRVTACGSQQVVQVACTSSNNSVEQRQEHQLDRRALLLALVAAPGLAQLQPAYAGQTECNNTSNFAPVSVCKCMLMIHMLQRLPA